MKMKSIDEKISELEKQLSEAKAEKERMESENPSTIGARIRKIMRIKVISHEAISKQVEISRQTVTHYLSDQRKISAEMLGKIAEILGVSCDYLILGKEDGGEDG